MIVPIDAVFLRNFPIFWLSINLEPEKVEVAEVMVATIAFFYTVSHGVSYFYETKLEIWAGFRLFLVWLGVHRIVSIMQKYTIFESAFCC